MRILIVEDNAALAAAIKHRFDDEGHAVTVVHDGEEGRHFLTQERFDLCILDVNLPGISGLEILVSANRQNIDIPVLMLTARDSIQDRVAGLDAGADDYLVKPFEMDELMARVRALLRRKPKTAIKAQQIGALTVHNESRFVSVDGVDLGLARREFATFECLSANAGNLVSKSRLLEHVYGVGVDVNDAAIEVLVSRVRKKIKPHGVEIKMARGLGYFLKVGA
ncbi:response regulator transcription factor [Alphaproteobacteria bacterium]|nr:response regulator transcription factor [Alphaproteobacteria bacterium]